MNLIVMLIFIYCTLLNASNKTFPNYIDKEMFSGKWFEVARSYNSFQRDCKNSYVDYILKENKYEIKNACTSIVDEEIISYKGVGKSANEDSNNFSKIVMTYFYIFSKEYQVVFNDNYEIVVVSDKDFENVWIMSRTKSIEKSKLDEVLTFLEKYINKNKLIFEQTFIKG